MIHNNGFTKQGFNRAINHANRPVWQLKRMILKKKIPGQHIIHIEKIPG